MALVIESGSRTIMKMTTPPTGWTKDTSFDNYALRVTTSSVVNRTVGQAFSTVFKSYNNLTCTGPVSFVVSPTTLDSIFTPVHSHFARTRSATANRRTGTPSPAIPAAGPAQPGTEGTAGLSTAHVHPTGTLATAAGSSITQGGSPVSVNLNIKYVDVIIAVRN